MLQWYSDWGTQIDHWNMMMEQFGKSPPDGFLEYPEILPISELYWIGFCDLSSERSGMGMGIGPIPRSKSLEYAREIGLEGEAVETFWDVVKALDVVQLRIYNKKPDAEDLDGGKWRDRAGGTAEGMKRILENARMRGAPKPRGTL